MEIRHGNPPWLARVSLNNRKRAQLRFGHYFKHHRLALEQNKLAIHIEIKNASTPTQIVSCQLTSLSAKATATMAKKAEIRPNIMSVRNPTSRSMSLIRLSRRIAWRAAS
ncbi:MAG: hypothetical protein WAK90_09685 [Pseudolabrys sp.]